ncbi:helix-turn-helix domain-containing protein [Paenibacillus sp. PR3]|uniref:Helix-turn-helix domain-containing protein n=1 Tax=Paenibacillus terricola TaxID=2763503 RepID=A0ABR8N1E0_9BACL|nr:helix-turn-helix domain-containing protein [Paenibacillus terricola]
MDSYKVGRLILSLRQEKHMTQKELADRMNISDKTISKWERGLGCPDVSLLSELSQVLGVHIEKILRGELDSSEQNKGNMKAIRFYVCAGCDNVMTSTGASSLSCCGRIIEPLIPQAENEEHRIAVEEDEDDMFIALQHEMRRDHYITFAAYISYDRLQLVKLYPEQNAEARFSKTHGGTLYIYCNRHGLWKREIMRRRAKGGRPK